MEVVAEGRTIGPESELLSLEVEVCMTTFGAIVLHLVFSAADIQASFSNQAVTTSLI
mgnify:CR=1 FL=1